jgi:hypothetical protein
VRRLAFLPVAVALSALASCVQKPAVRLNHAEISGIDMRSFPANVGIVMTIVIDVYNPNGYDVAVRGVRGQTILADQYPVPVLFQAPPDGIWMPAKQTTPVRVPVTVPLQLALLLVQQSFASPTIPYRFTGAADVTGSRTFKIEKDNYAFDVRGAITRDQVLAVIPNTLFPH